MISVDACISLNLLKRCRKEPREKIRGSCARGGDRSSLAMTGAGEENEVVSAVGGDGKWQWRGGGEGARGSSTAGGSGWHGWVACVFALKRKPVVSLSFFVV